MIFPQKFASSENKKYLQDHNKKKIFWNNLSV